LEAGKLEDGKFKLCRFRYTEEQHEIQEIIVAVAILEKPQLEIF